MNKIYNSLDEYLQENSKRDRHIIFFGITSSDLTKSWNDKTIEQFNKACKYYHSIFLFMTITILLIVFDLVFTSINNSMTSLLINLIIYAFIAIEIYLAIKITKCREIVDSYISECNKYLINTIISGAYFPGEDKLDSINNLVFSLSFMLNIRNSNYKEIRKIIKEVKAKIIYEERKNV